MTTNMKIGSSKPEGLIKYYGLTDWWLSVFISQEREYIENRCQSIGLTQNKVTFSSLSVVDFLSSFSSWFVSKQDEIILKKIQVKLSELAKVNPVIKPGYLRGRHFSTFVADVEIFKTNNQAEEVEKLLLELVEATEVESKSLGYGVAPWYYEQLAILYRRNKNYSSEVAILERFASQKHSPGVKSHKLMDRLEKARTLSAKQRTDKKNP